jgi:ATP-binding protein involved in chromosome partitioning
LDNVDTAAAQQQAQEEMRKKREQANKEMAEKLKQNMANIKHKILVLSNKGGVGKSSVSVNLSCSLAEKGYRVGLLDADLHGPSVAKMLGFEGEKLTGSNGQIKPIQVRENLSAVSMASLIESPDTPLVWRGPLKGIAIKQFLAEVSWGDLDFLIIDSPPGTGDEPLSVCQLIPELDGGVIVTTPQEIALSDSRKCIHFLRDINIPILGIIENMSGFRCPNCGEKIDLFMTGGGKKAASDFKVPFLGAIPIDVQMVKSADEGQPFICSNKESETSQAFEEIIRSIISQIKL